MHMHSVYTLVYWCDERASPNRVKRWARVCRAWSEYKLSALELRRTSNNYHHSSGCALQSWEWRQVTGGTATREWMKWRPVRASRGKKKLTLAIASGDWLQPHSFESRMRFRVYGLWNCDCEQSEIELNWTEIENKIPNDLSFSTGD